MFTEEKAKAIRKYLDENRDTAIDIARELNSWDGSFPEFDTWDLAELVQCYCADYESTRRFMDTILDSLDTLRRCSDWVRFSEYGDYIESIDDYELREEVADYFDDIIQGIEDHYPQHIDIDDDELKSLIDEDEEDEDSENGQA